MSILLCLVFLISILLEHPIPHLAFSLPIHNNVSKPHASPSSLCHAVEHNALLHFKNSFIINITNGDCPYDDHDETFSFRKAGAKTKTWKEGTDCCKWQGITCDSFSGHVIGIDLTCSGLVGAIHSNSSLFQLHRLQSLILAWNNFSGSPISPKFGMLQHLQHLDLSNSEFAGIVPLELSQLNKLNYLNLSISEQMSYSPHKLEFSNFKSFIDNITHHHLLRQLDLSSVTIKSPLPKSLTNLTSLISLQLPLCELIGEFPTGILNLPYLNFLVLNGNIDLSAKFTSESNWSSPLEILILSGLSSFSGCLPTSFPQAIPTLRVLALEFSNFYGVLPTWIWNTTSEITLGWNKFSGELPLSVNTKNLHKVDLFNNMLSGIIPSWLFTLPSLTSLILSSNRFSGPLSEFHNHSCVHDIDLSDNMLIGPLPNSIFGLDCLQYLDLSLNNLSGIVQLDMFSNLKNITNLNLSSNKLSVIGKVESADESGNIFPRLDTLVLSSCNIGPKIPSFIKQTIESLTTLDLSNNKIHGEIPKWIQLQGTRVPQSFKKRSYIQLLLFNNHLTSGVEHLPWVTPSLIDIRNNMLRGSLLFPDIQPLSVVAFLASGNKLDGDIPKLFCNLTTLSVLDLSNNSLSGELPHCFEKVLSQVSYFNVRSNNFHGTIPSQAFSECTTLTTLDLNGNQLEGKIPSSTLGNCTQLQVLDLGNNNFEDTFPYWLGKLPGLQVLVLRSNRFHGPLKGYVTKKHTFSDLRVLDFSDNNFNGTLSNTFFRDFQGMKQIQSSPDDGPVYMDGGIGYTSVSVDLSVKGTVASVQILTNLVTIDLSCNRFQGRVPESIGDLGAIRWLNLSHNLFNGKIPYSFGKLNVLESLDLSSNELTGMIPQELGDVKTLETLNVSSNRLLGPIPRGPQFNTFTNESYLANQGLCGFPLSKKCKAIEASPLPKSTKSIDASEEDDDTIFARLSMWQMILMGCGFGFIVGFVSGYFIVLEKNPLWLLRLICQLESFMKQVLKKYQKT